MKKQTFVLLLCLLAASTTMAQNITTQSDYNQFVAAYETNLQKGNKENLVKNLNYLLPQMQTIVTNMQKQIKQDQDDMSKAPFWSRSRGSVTKESLQKDIDKLSKALDVDNPIVADLQTAVGNKAYDQKGLLDELKNFIVW